jgi:hypothetical protein
VGLQHCLPVILGLGVCMADGRPHLLPCSGWKNTTGCPLGSPQSATLTCGARKVRRLAGRATWLLNQGQQQKHVQLGAPSCRQTWGVSADAGATRVA